MDAYLGEIRLFSGNYAPKGWALCQGQLLSIAQNQALFSLLYTTYGGNGQTTFALPDLRGRVPIHVSNTHPLGEQGGSESVTLIANQMPMHTHQVNADSLAATQTTPGGAVWAEAATEMYAEVAPNATMSAQAIAVAGGSQPHENMMPYLGLNFIICLEGYYPSRD